MSKDLEKISREEASLKGLKKYYSETPCSKGHLGEFYVKKDLCVTCVKERQKLYYEKNREKVITKATNWAKSNKNKVNAKNAKWRNSNRDRANTLCSDWAKRNPGIRASYEAKRELAKFQRTPKWSDLEKIKEIYVKSHRISQETGIKHSVDHIIPLRGKFVSGLHVPENLQVIPAKINSSKSNKFDIEEYNRCQDKPMS